MYEPSLKTQFYYTCENADLSKAKHLLETTRLKLKDVAFSGFRASLPGVEYAYDPRKREQTFVFAKYLVDNTLYAEDYKYYLPDYFNDICHMYTVESAPPFDFDEDTFIYACLKLGVLVNAISSMHPTQTVLDIIFKYIRPDELSNGGEFLAEIYRRGAKHYVELTSDERLFNSDLAVAITNSNSDLRRYFAFREKNNLTYTKEGFPCRVFVKNDIEKGKSFLESLDKLDFLLSYFPETFGFNIIDVFRYSECETHHIDPQKTPHKLIRLLTLLSKYPDINWSFDYLYTEENKKKKQDFKSSVLKMLEEHASEGLQRKFKQLACTKDR